MKAKQLQPNDLIKELRTKGAADTVCEAQWKVLEKETLKLGSLEDSLVVVDTSGSMHSPNGVPIDVAVGLGLLIGQAGKGPWKNQIITFHENPTFYKLKDGDSLYNRYKHLTQASWGGSTNIQKTFDMILDRAKAFDLTEADMPKRIFIISDMQFNQVGGYSRNTNFQEIERKYNDSRYRRPQIIFWNVNGKSTDFPVSVSDNGTALISGFSTSIMSAILTGSDFSPYGILRETIDAARYKDVYNALSNEDAVVVD